MGVEQRISLQEGEKRFLGHLKSTLGIARKNNAEIAVVGGLALRAVLNQPVQWQRPNGTTPDVDAIGMGPDVQTLKITSSEIEQYRNQFKDCPEVGLELAVFSDKKATHHSPLELLSGIRKDSQGNLFLTYRDIEVPISPETMKVVERDYGGVTIPTLPAETIFWRYYVRCGVIKPKDEAKIAELREYIEKTGGDHIDPELYKPYEEFYHLINTKYPLQAALTQFYWQLDKQVGGKISGAKGPIYDLIALLHK